MKRTLKLDRLNAVGARGPRVRLSESGRSIRRPVEIAERPSDLLKRRAYIKSGRRIIVMKVSGYKPVCEAGPARGRKPR